MFRLPPLALWRAGRPELHAEQEGVAGHLEEPVVRFGHGAIVNVHAGTDAGEGCAHQRESSGGPGPDKKECVSRA